MELKRKIDNLSIKQDSSASHGDGAPYPIILISTRGDKLWLLDDDPFNPLTPTSDQYRISPYNIKTISSRQVMRIKKIISEGILSWSNTKFSKLTPHELYGTHLGELLVRSWELKG